MKGVNVCWILPVVVVGAVVVVVEEEDKDGGGEAKEKAAEVACSSRRPIRGGGEVRRLIGSTFSTPKVSMGSLFNECVLVVKVVKREEAESLHLYEGRALTGGGRSTKGSRHQLPDELRPEGVSSRIPSTE